MTINKSDPGYMPPVYLHNIFKMLHTHVMSLQDYNLK